MRSSFPGGSKGPSRRISVTKGPRNKDFSYIRYFIKYVWGSTLLACLCSNHKGDPLPFRPVKLLLLRGRDRLRTLEGASPPTASLEYIDRYHRYLTEQPCASMQNLIVLPVDGLAARVLFRMRPRRVERPTRATPRFSIDVCPRRFRRSETYERLATSRALDFDEVESCSR